MEILTCSGRVPLSAQCKLWWDSYCSAESTVKAPKPHTHKSEEGRNTWLLSAVIICKLLGEYSHIQHRCSQISRHVVLACAADKHKAGGVSWVDGGSSPAETYASVIASHRQWAKHFSCQRLSWERSLWYKNSCYAQLKPDWYSTTKGYWCQIRK